MYQLYWCLSDRTSERFFLVWDASLGWAPPLAAEIGGGIVPTVEYQVIERA